MPPSFSIFLILCALLAQSLFSYVLSQEICRESGDVRLVGSVNMTEGRLEICVNGLWGTVCNDGINRGEAFDRNAARVVCRQLGFPESILPEVISNVFFGGGASFQTIYLDALHCTGTEPNLLNCTHSGIGVHDCKHPEDVGIICMRSQDCMDGDVRLVDGDNYDAAKGRVEYCVGGLWGTVCDYNWDTADVKVLCRQLGLTTNEPMVLNKYDVPRVINPLTPIVLDGVNCQGTETSLRDCGSEVTVEYCAHNPISDNSDAGASCTNIRECNDSDVRLVQLEGDMENEGRVEYCSSGRWGQICHDYWDNNDAKVVCRQLGYNVEDGNAVARTAQVYHQGERRFIDIFVEKLECVGTEGTVSQCSQSSHSCIRPGAGIICPVQLNASECTDRDVRLQGGELSSEIGRVEVCLGGQWGLVCDDYWDDIDASVVCRQLGYKGGVATKMSTFGMTIGGHFVLDDVKCSGNESNIFDCQYLTNKTTDCQVGRKEEAGILCGVTRESRERCTEEHTNKTLSLPVGSGATNLTAGSIGTCQPYLHVKSKLCNSFYESTDYIFTTMNQSIVSNELDGRILPVLSGDDEECGDLISRVLCHYFFAPCGVNGLLHLPLAVCQEECQYVQSACTNQWRIANNLLSTAGLSTISCSASGALLKGLAPCCIDTGIGIKNDTTFIEKDNITSIESPVMTEDTLGLVVGLLAAFLIVLIGVVIVTICLASVVVKKRKATIRSLQLEVLTSPMRTSIAPLAAHFLKDDHPDFGADVKLRSNGGSHAIPNPYSSKQELALSPPLPLSPTENKMMNRISSSIIRELSSNMLIPYTRLKLLECVGQGEFGVVYKAQYTEPEGEIGYKTSTVAVKTLKGFFDNSQVNKIMEESIKMKHFDHPNVLHLIGVCLDAGPAPYVVMPYMANGSLLHYLKKERKNLVLPVGVDDDVKIDVRKRLTVMCLQIASGMEYLAEEKFVHRDLAARNCMIDIHFVIKIADFGLSEDVYAKNYFRQSGSDKSIKLPVKWMAPESLSDGVFSEKSDVIDCMLSSGLNKASFHTNYQQCQWSFGVTCWEIFSGGKTPYPGVDPLLLSQMLDTEQRLNKPLNAACPDEMCSLMMNCWSKKAQERPSFRDIVTTISNYTEVIAGYLDINFNPFESTCSPAGGSAAAVITTVPDSPDSEKDVLDSSELLRKLEESNQMKPCNKTSKSPKVTPKASPKVSPRASPRPSPRASPHISPRASPLLKLRNVKEDQASTSSSAGIKICIESPSEDGSITSSSGLLSVK